MSVLLLLVSLALSFYVGLGAKKTSADTDPVGSVWVTLGVPYAKVGGETESPTGWVLFCQQGNEYACDRGKDKPLDVVLTAKVWQDLVSVNNYVNEKVIPMTDEAHWGVVEKWNLPTDGYGDCEDYALFKQKVLIDAGWPRSALLLTVVLDPKTKDRHALLTVKTDQGEFVLDVLYKDILLWSNTGYKFLKRQSQDDPHVWLSIESGAKMARAK